MIMKIFWLPEHSAVKDAAERTGRKAWRRSERYGRVVLLHFASQHSRLHQWDHREVWKYLAITTAYRPPCEPTVPKFFTTVCTTVGIFFLLVLSASCLITTSMLQKMDLSEFKNLMSFVMQIKNATKKKKKKKHKILKRSSPNIYNQKYNEENYAWITCKKKYLLYILITKYIYINVSIMLNVVIYNNINFHLL